VSIGDKALFEDICNMGRNLYSLLINHQSSEKDPATPKNEIDGQGSRFGQYSHGTTFYHLGGAEGSEFGKSFKLPSPMKLADKLKKKLLSEAPTPDWEVLDDDAWKVEEEPGSGTQVNKDLLIGDKGSPRRGTSGWMRVKNR
jgi:hypothetical protein